MGRLNARNIKTLEDGFHADGDRLYLRVRGSNRHWVFRWRRQRKTHELGLGPTTLRSLREARELAAKMNRALMDGGDPRTILHPPCARPKKPFREVALDLIEDKRPGWRNAKHTRQWRTTLEKYVFPALGNMDPEAITPEHVLEVLKPLWTTKPETASRVRQRIESVLDRAAVLGLRDQDRVNPAAWKGNLAHLLPKPTRVRARQHFPAIPYAQLSDLVARLEDVDAVSARCLRFIILTACRLGEATGARWDEIDREACVWTVPGSRMKAGKPHTVPLSRPVLQILERQGENGREGLIFASVTGRPLSDVAVSNMLHRYDKRATVHGMRSTVHGMRSAFRDWAADKTPHSREVIEQCLAHSIGRVEASYRRTDLLEKRRQVMQDWADYLCGPKGGSPP